MHAGASSEQSQAEHDCAAACLPDKLEGPDSSSSASTLSPEGGLASLHTGHAQWFLQLLHSGKGLSARVSPHVSSTECPGCCTQVQQQPLPLAYPPNASDKVIARTLLKHGLSLLCLLAGLRL